MFTFTFNGVEYVNFDLNDQDVANELIKNGIPIDFINSVKNKPKEPTEIDYLLDLDYRLSIVELGL